MIGIGLSGRERMSPFGGEEPDRGEYGAGERPKEDTANRLRWQFECLFFVATRRRDCRPFRRVI
jgi:hypothetical protein